MAPRPERAALRRRYERKRAQVVLDAARVFARSGYDQTSVPDLSEALGMAAGALYHYFDSKQDLLIAICDQLMDPLLAEAEELLADERPSADRLRALLRLWVGHVIEHRDHMLVFQQERHVIEQGGQWRKVREHRKRFERLLDAALRQAREDGVTRLGDERLMRSALLGMVNHTAQWHRPRGRLDAADIADGYAALVLTD
jgi:AcrR family transcriptional regulator